ncbi:MAG: acyltransferase [Bacteroidaceae bacterium]|nr:acyltransferase [Bacteroidaceae bacterium]
MLIYRKVFFLSRFVRLLPETGCFGIKRFIWRLCGAKIGKNVRICSIVTIIGVGTLEIGDNTWIGPQNFISVSSTVKIGANVDIAPRCTILNGSHKIGVDGVRVAGKGVSEDILIGDGCWICTNSTILGTSDIGHHSLVAACSCTKGFYPSGSLIKGIIAKASPLRTQS